MQVSASLPVQRDPERRHPAHGVLASLGQPTVVFLTVCTHQRVPWLAQRTAQQSLEEVWRQADAWLVIEYLLMPDHLHLFCSPRDLKFTLEAWVRYWKSQFRRLHLDEPWDWQRDFWDTRMRDANQYHDKWIYVQENPVRKGLVAKMDDWPYKGRVHELHC
jgi:putative transposase